MWPLTAPGKAGAAVKVRNAVRGSVTCCAVLALAIFSCSEEEQATQPTTPDTLCACVDSDTLCCPWLEYWVEHADSWPAVSPDGGRVAFSRLSLQGMGIWLAQMDGPDERFLTIGDQPTWSPDGSEILFVRDFDIYVLSLSDSSVVRLTQNGSSLFPRWSPDGSQIAFTCGHSGEICIVDTDGGNGTSLDIGGGIADWSPNGARLVFVGEPAGEGSNDLWVIDRDGENRHRLSSGQWPWVENPRWSPDGKMIALTAPEWGDSLKRTAIWLIGPDGSGACRLTHGRAAEPSWSSDGSSIVYSSALSRKVGVFSGLS